MPFNAQSIFHAAYRQCQENDTYCLKIIGAFALFPSPRSRFAKSFQEKSPSKQAKGTTAAFER